MMKDDYSHWRSLYFIKNKSETLRYLEDFFKKTDKHLEREIKIFRSDNGLDFNKKRTNIWLRIRKPFIVPFTLEQKSSAEREKN